MTKVVADPTPGLRVKVRQLGQLRGKASWYCQLGRSSCVVGHPDRVGMVDAYAAAGPRLRAAICGIQSCTSWRNRVVSVSGDGHTWRVRLIDWCQCYRNQSNEKIVDLYHDVFYGVDTDGDGRIDVPGVGGYVTIRW